MPRYFLMRCAEARIVERAVQKGLWPVSHGCQDRLNDAFASGALLMLLQLVQGGALGAVAAGTGSVLPVPGCPAAP